MSGAVNQGELDPFISLPCQVARHWHRKRGKPYGETREGRGNEEGEGEAMRERREGRRGGREGGSGGEEGGRGGEEGGREEEGEGREGRNGGKRGEGREGREGRGQ